MQDDLNSILKTGLAPRLTLSRHAEEALFSRAEAALKTRALASSQRQTRTLRRQTKMDAFGAQIKLLVDVRRLVPLAAAVALVFAFWIEWDTTPQPRLSFGDLPELPRSNQGVKPYEVLWKEQNQILEKETEDAKHRFDSNDSSS